MTIIYEHLNSWRADLKGLGFVPHWARGGTGLYLDRSLGFATQAVGVHVSRQRAINVQLTVNMPLPLSEPQRDVRILTGDVGIDRVTTIEPWRLHSYSKTWWPPHEHENAWAALSDKGLLWFQRFATLHALIKYIEAAFARHEPSWFDRMWSKASAQKLTKIHYEYLLYLAMLYEVDGKYALALERIAAYEEYVKPRGIWGWDELSRVERHISALRARVNRHP